MHTRVPAPPLKTRRFSLVSLATMNDDEELVPQDPIETDATNEGEQQQPQTEDVPNIKAPRRSQRVRKSVFLLIMKCTTLKNFKWRMSRLV